MIEPKQNKVPPKRTGSIGILLAPNPVEYKPNIYRKE